MLGGGTTVLRGHADPLGRLALSPDGKRLVCADFGGQLKLWDVDSGRELWTTSQGLGSVSFGPHGKRFVGGGSDGRIRFWNLEKLDEEPMTLSGHTGFVTGVAFSPAGDQIASASRDGTVRFWDADTGQALHTLSGHENYVYGVAFSPEGRYVVSASADRTVRLWNVLTGQLLWTSQQAADVLTGVAYHPDGTQIAAGCDDSTLILLDAATGKILRVLSGHAGPVNSVAFSPDGERIFSASNDGTVKVWNATKGEELLTLRGHEGAVSGLAISADGKTLASCSGDLTVRVWHSVARSGLDKDVPRRLVAHWTFDEGRGGHVGDSAGDTDSFAIGPIWTSGPVGGALEFDGETSFVDVPMAHLRFDQITIAMWIKFDKLNQLDTSLISNKGWLPYVIHYMLKDVDWFGVDGVLQLSINGNRGGQLGSDMWADRLLIASRWYHTVATYDSATGKVQFYIDGQLDCEKTYTTAHVADLGYPKGVYIGKATAAEGDSRYWDGAFDDVRIYNYVLKPDQIESLYAAGDPPPPDRNYYRLQAIVHLKQGNFDKAVETYERFLDSSAQGTDATADRDRAQVEEALLQELESQLDVPGASARQYIARAWSLGLRTGSVDSRLAAVAVRLAQKAVELEPENGHFHNTLGIAQYRAGQYEKALATLTKGNKIKGEFPDDLAFLAMTHHQLGQIEEARAALTGAQESMKQPQWAGDEELQHYLKEAEALINAAPAE